MLTIAGHEKAGVIQTRCGQRSAADAPDTALLPAPGTIPERLSANITMAVATAAGAA